MISSQRDKVIEAIGMFWFPQRCLSMVIPFLQYAVQNLYFLFIPTLPAVSAGEDTILSDQDPMAVFSLFNSFSSLHEASNKKPTFSSDIDYLDSILSSYHCDEYCMKEEVVWTVPTHFLGLQPPGGIEKPALPPKPTS